MLKIRPEQLEALQSDLQRRFVYRVASALRKRFAAVAALDDDELLAAVELAVARAREHGITWQSAIADFAALHVGLGAAFELHPLVCPILLDTRTLPDLRIRRLFAELTPPQWADVRRFAAERS